MTVPKCTAHGCMRLDTIKRRGVGKQWQPGVFQVSQGQDRTKNIRGASIRKQISELIFENCIDCTSMAAIPQGAFAAYKVRANLQRGVPISDMNGKDEMPKENLYNSRPMLEGWELTPLKYNSKLMNSIWGLYNRYSVHNFKKNTDSNEGVSRMFAAVSENRISAANAVAAAAATAKSARIIPNAPGLQTSL